MAGPCRQANATTSASTQRVAFDQPYDGGNQPTQTPTKMPPRRSQRAEPEETQPTQTQRRRQRDESSEDDNHVDVDMTQGDQGSGSVQQLAKGLVRYALSCEHSRKPIKRQDINEKVLGSHARDFKQVFTEANRQLMHVFGMQFAELPKQERVTLRQKRAAAASESQTKSSSIWVLQTILPDQYRIPEIIGPSRPLEDGRINVEDSYVALYTMVIALIIISGGMIPEGKLDRALRRMNADQTTPVGTKDKTLVAMIKDGYIVKVKDASGGGDETIDYIVGPRGKVEVGGEGVAQFIRTVYGASEDQAELEKRIQRTLDVADAHNSAPVGEASQAVQAGRKHGRPRNDADDIDSLLNHEAAPAPRRPSVTSTTQTTTTIEAADTLTTLATLGHGKQYAPRELPDPTAFSSAPRRTSSIGSLHAPVEPSPPVEPPQAHSPTLEHYHHGSNSPEEQKRRQSLLSRTSPAPVLAPIQNLSTALHDQMQDEATMDDTLQPHSNPTIADAPLTSPQPFIKNEPSGTPRESTPALSADTVDMDTLKALEVAKQSDLGLRRRHASVTESVPSPAETKPTKKRPAPSGSTVKKKGTAKTSKPNKKRRVETEDGARSVTPTSRASRPPKGMKKGSHAGTPNLDSSPAPENSSQVHASDDDDSSEDHNLYCICKKPDNHKWMIGCDGGCDDWFHGDCVNMKQADEELVDKFICPLCEENGRGHTTWKPMCRRDGCRKPARLIKDRESKYCSDDCGVLFMSEQLNRTAGAKNAANGAKKKQQKKKTDNEDEEPTPLGGTLRAKDLKALVDASPNIQAFKNLGTGVLTPPQTASPSRATFPSNGEDLAMTAGEIERLTALHKEKSQLKDRLEVLKDREKFVSMAKEQAVRLADREKLKMKDFCGYDSRLSWSDAEFLLWRNSRHGRAAFNHSTLSPTEEQMSATDGDAMDVDIEAKETACLKKRCQKHPQWQKLNLQDARFEELEVVEAIRECEKEERSVRERARRRGAKDGLAKELIADDGSKDERNREGWVEVVGS
ncbi:PHD transcription factor [Pyrenophora seminiperda CCB06]|uniref:PHD transcription factor n=1 Tax=Pyrenophora seminiperda CCB06 TaxID=1302712 RepID=A0A3M7M5Y9_9PLEO|nr:PHD transcription factor [Pyrenophora seminiperda CCB06]